MSWLEFKYSFHLPTSHQIILDRIFRRLFHVPVLDPKHPLRLACIKNKRSRYLLPSTINTFRKCCKPVSRQRALNARNDDILNNIACETKKKKRFEYEIYDHPKAVDARQSWKAETSLEMMNLSPPAASVSSARTCAVATSLTSTNPCANLSSAMWGSGASRALYQEPVVSLRDSGELTSCITGP